jgi:hypothetical protein
MKFMEDPVLAMERFIQIRIDTPMRTLFRTLRYLYRESGTRVTTREQSTASSAVQAVSMAKQEAREQLQRGPKTSSGGKRAE